MGPVHQWVLVPTQRPWRDVKRLCGHDSSFSSTCLQTWTPARPSKHRCPWGALAFPFREPREPPTAGIFLPIPEARPREEARSLSLVGRPLGGTGVPWPFGHHLKGMCGPIRARLCLISCLPGRPELGCPGSQPIPKESRPVSGPGDREGRGHPPGNAGAAAHHRLGLQPRGHTAAPTGGENPRPGAAWPAELEFSTRTFGGSSDPWGGASNKCAARFEAGRAALWTLGESAQAFLSSPPALEGKGGRGFWWDGGGLTLPK